MRNFLKGVLDFVKLVLQALVVIALIITLIRLWLPFPSIPGVHGIWKFLLDVLGAVLYFELFKLIYAACNKKASGNTL